MVLIISIKEKKKRLKKQRKNNTKMNLTENSPYIHCVLQNAIQNL